MTLVNSNVPYAYERWELPVVQVCGCGHHLRCNYFGEDFYAAQKTCQKCGKTTMVQAMHDRGRFTGLERIFMEHRLEGIAGYGSAPLPDFMGDPDSIAADILSYPEEFEEEDA